jgi:hypothetical protein
LQEKRVYDKRTFRSLNLVRLIWQRVRAGAYLEMKYERRESNSLGLYPSSSPEY